MSWTVLRHFIYLSDFFCSLKTEKERSGLFLMNYCDFLDIYVLFFFKLSFSLLYIFSIILCVVSSYSFTSSRFILVYFILLPFIAIIIGVKNYEYLGGRYLCSSNPSILPIMPAYFLAHFPSIMQFVKSRICSCIVVRSLRRSLL